MFAKIRAWWSTKTLWIRRLWFNEGPADDCFWWMDVLFLLAGIRSALTSNWTHERKIIIVCHGLFIYNFVVFYLQLWEGVTAKMDTTYIVMELTI
ncbi:AAEL017285-PA, partial [Aedes aegypti]